MSDEFLKNLNPEQRAAVEHLHGPIMVFAGAGSGKTRVLTHRIAHLVRHHRVSPSRILAVTFTNKAAHEMRERLAHMLGDEAARVWVSTFHSASVRILRRYAPQVGLSSDFVIYDDDDSKSVIKRILKQLGIAADKKVSPATFSHAISYLKDRNISPEEFKPDPWDKIGTLKGEVYKLYNDALAKANAVDFADLLLKVLQLFTKHPEVLAQYQSWLEFILIDEFQDTNGVQYDIVKLLGAKHKNVFIVGDDDQSIYKFRGADYRNLGRFEKDFSDAKVVALEQNYRSTSRILDIANSVIAANHDRRPKKLWTDLGEGEMVKTIVAGTELDESAMIAAEVQELLRDGYAPSDIACLYRVHAQSRALEDAFTRARIPYRIFGGPRFFDRKEIRDLIGYLRLLVNPLDDASVLRIINVPARKIGAKTVEDLSDNARTEGVALLAMCAQSSGALHGFSKMIGELTELVDTASLPSLIEEILKRTGYIKFLEDSDAIEAETRLENLSELVAFARSVDDAAISHRENLLAFLEQAALVSQPTDESDTKEYVSLMSLHIAKGLEFPVVFVIGVEEGLLPHYRSGDDPEEIAEERRLLYVGITRAQKKLYLTRAFERGMLTQITRSFGMASRFAQEFPDSSIKGGAQAFVSGAELFEW